MELTKYKIGELIELTNEKNANGLYGEDDAIGVNIDKIIMPMRGNLEKKDFSNFHLVPPRHFAYNPRGSRTDKLKIYMSKETQKKLAEKFVKSNVGLKQAQLFAGQAGLKLKNKLSS